jgi:hypothetical protein
LTLRDGPHEVALRADGSLAGLPGLSLEARADVILALRSGGLPEPDDLARLRGAKGTLMGEAARAGFHVLGPVATFVRTAQPMFRWTPHPKARGYEVAVFSGLAKVASVRVTGVVEASAPIPLERGRTYLWQVAALTPSGRVIAPTPPEAEARFRVLEAPAAAALDKALTATDGSDLAAGVLLARAGVRDGARRGRDSFRPARCGQPGLGGGPSAARVRPSLVTLGARWESDRGAGVAHGYETGPIERMTLFRAM